MYSRLLETLVTLTEFKVHKIDGAYLDNYVNEVKQDEDRVKSMILAQKQLETINNNFNND
jgi:hypothetical protein